MAETIKTLTTRTTQQILEDAEKRVISGEGLTLADILLRRGPTLQGTEARRGTIYFLNKGCLTKCTTSDVKGRVT